MKLAEKIINKITSHRTHRGSVIHPSLSRQVRAPHRLYHLIMASGVDAHKSLLPRGIASLHRRRWAADPARSRRWTTGEGCGRLTRTKDSETTSSSTASAAGAKSLPKLVNQPSSSTNLAHYYSNSPESCIFHLPCIIFRIESSFHWFLSVYWQVSREMGKAAGLGGSITSGQAWNAATSLKRKSKQS